MAGADENFSQPVIEVREELSESHQGMNNNSARIEDLLVNLLAENEFVQKYLTGDVQINYPRDLQGSFKMQYPEPFSMSYHRYLKFFKHESHTGYEDG